MNAALKTMRSPKVTVNVTQEIIERSVKASSRACMIAEAIKAAVPNASSVTVDLQTSRFTDKVKGIRYVYLTPRDAQKRLLDFDQGFPVEPFSLLLKGGNVMRSRVKGGTMSLELKYRKKRDAIPSEARLRVNQEKKIEVVGGKPPPQMRTQRRFGIKAFVGSGA